jgi:hypothetical protein
MDKAPAMEGRFMSMVLSPKAKIVKQQAKQAIENIGGEVGGGQEQPKQST